VKNVRLEGWNQVKFLRRVSDVDVDDDDVKEDGVEDILFTKAFIACVCEFYIR